MTVKTADGENFVLFNNKDDGIVVFGRPSHLDFLADADCVLMDGTFKFCPKYFSQLYILVAEKNDRLFRTLKQLTPNFHPKIMIDFEEAVINSIRTNFPKLCHILLPFPFGQAWWRKIRNFSEIVAVKKVLG